MERGTVSVAVTTARAVHSDAECGSFEASAAGGPSTTAVDVSHVTALVSVEKSTLEHVLSERVDRALVARGLHDREVRRPSVELMIRAAEAMRFGPRQQEVANLIASAMDPKFGSAVLPSHLDVLNQLTSDELALLRVTPPYGFPWIMSDLVYVLASRQVQIAYRNIAPEQFANACATPRNIPQYIDNMTRLHLVYCTEGEGQTEEVRKATARIPFVRSLISRRPAGALAGIQSKAMRLTDFGEQLRRACL